MAEQPSRNRAAVHRSRFTTYHVVTGSPTGISQPASVRGAAIGAPRAWPAPGAESAANRGHFLRIREITIVGYFTSGEVGKDVLHFEPVPGIYQACIPLSEVGNVSWTWSR